MLPDGSCVLLLLTKDVAPDFPRPLTWLAPPYNRRRHHEQQAARQTGNERLHVRLDVGSEDTPPVH